MMKFRTTIDSHLFFLIEFIDENNLCSFFIHSEEQTSNQIFSSIFMSKFRRCTLISCWTLLIFFFIIYMLDRISRDEQRQIFLTIVDYRWNPIVNLTIQFNQHEQIQFEFEKNFNRTDWIEQIRSQLNDENLFAFEEHVIVRINTINRDTHEIYDDLTIDDISSQGVIISDKISRDSSIPQANS